MPRREYTCANIGTDYRASEHHTIPMAKIREITHGTSEENRQSVSGITAQILNEHYAAISIDMSYQPTQVKLTAAPRDSLISEVCVSTAVHTEAYGHRARRADPPPQLNFEDQYAFRPTGSTTAAIIAILHMVRSMLSSNEYVPVFAFDFSKAFDTVQRSTLRVSWQRCATTRQYLQLTGCETFSPTDIIALERRYAGQLSTVAAIKASVIQGSGLGPASTLSQLLICIRAQQTTTYLNMLMTPTWLCPQRTQARDAKKSSKSASGQLRII